MFMKKLNNNDDNNNNNNNNNNTTTSTTNNKNNKNIDKSANSVQDTGKGGRSSSEVAGLDPKAE